MQAFLFGNPFYKLKILKGLRLAGLLKDLLCHGFVIFKKKIPYFLSINSTAASRIVYDILFLIRFTTLIKVHVNGNFSFTEFW